METYQAKNINKEDIDNIVKVIYNKFEKEKSKEVKDQFNFYYNTPIISLNNIRFIFQIVCFYYSEEDKENWKLRHIILDDDDLNVEEGSVPSLEIKPKYFNSKTLQELIVKYVNNKFIYDKYDNKIMLYKDYLEEECVRKLFHSNIECCVCYDNLLGNVKTKCGHDLCLECYNKIKGKKKCPVCRACLCCGLQENCEDYDY